MLQRLVIALTVFIGLVGAVVVAGYLTIFAAGTDRAARAVPADGTGSTNDARPGMKTRGAPQSSVTSKGPGPGRSAAWACIRIAASRL